MLGHILMKFYFGQNKDILQCYVFELAVMNFTSVCNSVLSVAHNHNHILSLVKCFIFPSTDLSRWYSSHSFGQTYQRMENTRQKEYHSVRSERATNRDRPVRQRVGLLWTRPIGPIEWVYRAERDECRSCLYGSWSRTSRRTTLQVLSCWSQW